MFLGIVTLISALTISAIAIYYSVAGLVAIFAASAVPIMIMGGALEVGKLVAASWLHWNWHRAGFLLKSYLLVSIFVLMIITSMGIFGFLSKAHIEQTANAQESLAQIEQIDDEIQRRNEQISQSSTRIDILRNSNSNRNSEIQDQIDLEQTRIDSVYNRIQPAVDEQLAIIDREQSLINQRIGNLETQLVRIDQELESLRVALADNQIQLAQTIVGTQPDGSFGPATEQAIENFRSQRTSLRRELVDQIEQIRTAPNNTITQAREEIQRLRSLAEQQIAQSNQLIDRLRLQLDSQDLSAIQNQIDQQQALIDQANSDILELNERKIQLEQNYRLLEVEVGPVKYLAEFIYGDTDQDLLEEAVRWVIIIIIFVFDPLAIVLLLASQKTFDWERQNRRLDIKSKKPTQDNTPSLTKSVKKLDETSHIIKPKDKVDTEEFAVYDEDKWPAGYDGKLKPTTKKV